MKKIMAAVSLILALLMMTVVPSFAETEEEKVLWTPPVSSPIYYANNISGGEVPVIDGEIKEGEYGKLTVKLDEHLKMKQSYPENGYVIDDERADYCSEYIDFYIAYDENFFYLAFTDYGSAWEAVEGDMSANFTARNNYSFGLGFQLDDFTNYFSIAIEGSKLAASFSDGKTSNFTTVEEGFAGIVSEAYLKKYLKADPTKVFCDDDISTLNGKNINSTEGQYIAVCELKFDKKLMLQRFNDYAYTEYEELPNAMFFHMTARSYVLYKNLKSQNESCTSYNKYFAADMRQYNDTQKTKFFMDYGLLPGSPQEYLPSVIVFGEEGSEIYLPKEAEPETEAPIIIPETDEIQEPHEETESESALDTEAPADEGGCGGTVSFAGLALVATLGTCAVFVRKKKEY